MLDVGCGTGSTTLAVARRLGRDGRCVGIDISEPMIAAARARAERAKASPASFICADAQTHAFEPRELRHDRLALRRDVLRRPGPGLREPAPRREAGAALRFVAWRSAAENPFMTTAERAAAPLLPSLPPRRPDAPGQFAFADAAGWTPSSSESGWSDIDIQPLDVPCAFPRRSSTATSPGSVPSASSSARPTSATRAQVIETVRAAFDAVRARRRGPLHRRVLDGQATHDA